MDLFFSFDEFGRLVCDLVDGCIVATATAANVPGATLDFVRAIDSLHDGVLSECLWEEQRGTYRWLFYRRVVVEVAVMGSAGVITGWQHVFRADCDLEVLERARGAVRRLGVATA